MARRTGPSPRIKMFAAALAKDERLISAILTAVLDALPAALEQIEAAALQKPAPAGEPMTHWQRQALRDAPPAP